MQELLKNIRIKVNEKIYIKDPESSELGKKIIQAGNFPIMKPSAAAWEVGQNWMD